MKLTKAWSSWTKLGYINITTDKTETDFMFHPNSWKTPCIGFDCNKYSWSFDITILCFAFMFTYTKKAWENDNQ